MEGKYKRNNFLKVTKRDFIIFTVITGELLEHGRCSRIFRLLFR